MKFRFKSRIIIENAIRTFLNLPGAVVLHSESELNAPFIETMQQPENDDDDKSILKFSLAGAQLKFSAVMNARGGLTIPAHGLGGNWIIKFPSTHYQGVYIINWKW